MRIRQFQKKIAQNGIDTAFLMNFESLKPSGNFLYLSGFSGIGILRVRKSGKAVLYVPEPEYPIALREVKGIDVVNYGRELKNAFKGAEGSRIGLDHSVLTLNQAGRLHKLIGKKSIDISGIVHSLRSRKDDDEISCIIKAVKISEGVLDSAIARIKEFRRESELYAFLCNETFKMGLRLSFDPIVASGRNSGKWHHVTSRDRIVDGFMILDFGVRYKGYAADLTRTVFIGRPGRKDILEYDKVRSVLKECEKMLLPGKQFVDIQEHAKKSLGEGFVHAIGHGIGLNEHESPFVGNDKMIEGNTLAIEPAVYVPYRYGIRLEKDYLITADGCRRLSSPCGKLIAI